MSSKSAQPALKGFQCMAVYAQPASEQQPGDSKKSKKSKSPSSSPSSPVLRYLYYKPHVVSSSDDSVKAGCTLFVVNLPFYYTEAHLSTLFSCFGAVESVHFLQHSSLQLDVGKIGAVQPSSFYRSAHVVYEEEESVEMAARTDLSQMPQQAPEVEGEEQQVGMKKWLSHYHTLHPQVGSLQAQVDRFMDNFDQRTSAEKAAARGGPQVDADGWTMVRASQRGKKRALLAREAETERAQQRASKKAKQNTVLHFYKHQEREQKKERLIALREKFEQDKLKIAKMKADRKFKPY